MVASAYASRLSACVVATVIGWDWRHIYETEPYILFRIQVVNAAVFGVRVSGYRGVVRLFSSPCGLPASMATMELQHGDTQELEVRQPIADRTAQALQEAGHAKRKVTVSVNEFHLVVERAGDDLAEKSVTEVALRPARFDVIPCGAYPVE